jgi:predicted phosphodiesterase
MSVLIFSDIHGNLPAFEKMLAVESGISTFISLGDVVNYGPWSNECVDLLESLPGVKLIGNHEEYFLSEAYPGKSDLVRSFFTKCIEKFSKKELIRSYQHSWQLDDFKCLHTINNAYVFPDSEISVVGNYLIGHSHYQFERMDTKYHVINVGSVGQNRKEINVINYVLYHREERIFELKKLIYDVDVVINKMKAEQYPSACITYYSRKARI